MIGGATGMVDAIRLGAGEAVVLGGGPRLWVEQRLGRQQVIAGQLRVEVEGVVQRLALDDPLAGGVVVQLVAGAQEDVDEALVEGATAPLRTRGQGDCRQACLGVPLLGARDEVVPRGGLRGGDALGLERVLAHGNLP